MERSVASNRYPAITEYLTACILLAALLCLGQIRCSRGLILGTLLLQLLLSLFAAFRGMAGPVLMFFLPWSTLMKLAPGSISFFTLSLILTCLAYAVRFPGRLNTECAVMAIFLLGVTLPAKLLAGVGLSKDYLLFVFLLVFFPAVMRECGTEPGCGMMTVFFACGIISAALAARNLIGWGGIARYIDVDAWANVVRYSGFYGDANFYSAHVSAALGGVMVQIPVERDWKRMVIWSVLMMVLICCGLMSASKMFVITLAVMALIWIPALLAAGRGIGPVLVAGAVCLVAGRELFSDLIDVILYRFSASRGISGLTTGRTDLWWDYAGELLRSPRLLLVGNGYTNLKLHGRSSHNTFIQILFQFGVVGGLLLFQWIKAYVSEPLYRCRIPINHAWIVTVGIFLPWMALDMLFFDEFFLMPMYAVCCMLSAQEMKRKMEGRELDVPYG